MPNTCRYILFVNERLNRNLILRIKQLVSLLTFWTTFLLLRTNTIRISQGLTLNWTLLAQTRVSVLGWDWLSGLGKNCSSQLLLPDRTLPFQRRTCVSSDLTCISWWLQGLPGVKLCSITENKYWYYSKCNDENKSLSSTVWKVLAATK